MPMISRFAIVEFIKKDEVIRFLEGGREKAAEVLHNRG
jgi:hypothetical protein